MVEGDRLDELGRRAKGLQDRLSSLRMVSVFGILSLTGPPRTRYLGPACCSSEIMEEGAQGDNPLPRGAQSKILGD